ncbi:MAG: hypothetical protein ABSE90_12840 [Verrucomicrobiota bacterium]
MRRFLTVLLLLGSLAAAGAFDAFSDANRAAAAQAAMPGRVVKVLPLFLDLKGHDAISPSLFDRDAYQAHLRQHTNAVSAIRFDVLWKAPKLKGAKLKLRAELRGVGEQGMPRQIVLETEVTPAFFRSWTSLKLEGAELRNFGSLVAWRVTLWNGEQLIGEQKSFLWELP